MAKKNDNKQIKIKLTGSLIGASETQKKVIRGLGLTKKDQVVEHYNSATIMGMVNKVPHWIVLLGFGFGYDCYCAVFIN